MQITELDAMFVRREIRQCPGYGVDPDCHVTSPHTEHEYHVPATIVDADGIIFPVPTVLPDKQRSGGHTLRPLLAPTSAAPDQTSARPLGVHRRRTR